MKLSKESIAGILEKERKTNPKVHYISDMTKANDFAEAVRIFNGRSIMAYGIEEIHEITAASNSLVIGLETLDNGKILAMERALRIAKKRKVPVLLDLTEVNSESPRAVKNLCSCVHRSSFTPNLPPASAPLVLFAAHSAFLSGGAVQHSGTFP